MANSGKTKTLRAMLAPEKPSVSYKPSTKTLDPSLQSSKQKSKKTWRQIDTFGYWKDFTMERLNALNESDYGQVLDLEIQAAEEELDDLRARAGLWTWKEELTTPAGMEQMLRWNHKVLQGALRISTTRLEPYPGACVCSDLPNNGDSITKYSSSAPLGWDHIVTLDGNAIDRALVVGLVRPSTLFEAKEVLPTRQFTGRPKPVRGSLTFKESKWLLRQLAHLCDEKGTRYGYILTEKALTVCRFSDLTVSAVGANGVDEEHLLRKKVEMSRIPWDFSGEKGITTDVAMWWLCMIALSDIEKKGGTQPGRQETPETEQLPDVPEDQELHFGFDAARPVVPTPFQASEAVAMKNQHETETHPANQLDSGILGHQGSVIDPENFDWIFEDLPVLPAAQEDTTETPSNAFYHQPPETIDTAMEDRSSEIGYEDESIEGEYESPEGQPQMNTPAATPGY